MYNNFSMFVDNLFFQLNENEAIRDFMSEKVEEYKRNFYGNMNHEQKESEDKNARL